MRIFKINFFEGKSPFELMKRALIIMLIGLHLIAFVKIVFNIDILFFRNMEMKDILSLLVITDIFMYAWIFIISEFKSRQEKLKELVKHETRYYKENLTKILNKYKKKNLPVILVGDGTNFKALNLDYSLYLEPYLVINKGRVYYLHEPVLINGIPFYFFIEEGVSYTFEDLIKLKALFVECINELEILLKEDISFLELNEESKLFKLLSPFVIEYEDGRKGLSDEFFIKLKTDDEFALDVLKEFLTSKVVLFSQNLTHLKKYLKKFDLTKRASEVIYTVREWQERAEKYTKRDIIINMMYLFGTIAVLVIAGYIISQFFASNNIPQLVEAINKLANAINQSSLHHVYNTSNTTINQTVKL